ncbi:unnamed protein product [Sphagnum jensenii]|uniref:Bidirectional sugar transporter SWEET n=1 Tax=Sphagnum jensenii TaxID=128206 RepID=A0ABP0VRY8_9BRYO
MAINFKLILGIIGNIISMCLFASPMPTFWDIIQKRDVQRYSAIPYVCTLLNCMLWVVYGLPDVSLQVLVVTINLSGCLIELIYISIYLVYAPKKTQTKALKLLGAMMVSFILVVVIVLEVVHDKHQRKLIIGVFCAMFSVGMYASPLTVMGMVIRTHSVEFMPFLLSLFNFMNGFVWFGYAFVGHIDIFIMIPNGLGALSGMAQLLLFFIYRNAPPVVAQQLELNEAGTPPETLPPSIHIISTDCD